MRIHRRLPLPLAALAATLLLTVPLAAPARAAVPAGFADVLVAQVASPTALAFTPDGRLLVATQPGDLRVVKGGALLPQPALALGVRVCSDFERGLLGVAVDPGFAQNGHLYLFYTFNKHGQCPSNTPASPVNRVARFTMHGDTVDPQSELVLVDNMPSPNGNHNAGDLFFGKDGSLYISIGDGGCDYANDSGCGGANDAARDMHVLTGKILRITRDGGIPLDNPFTGAGTARCNLEGRTTPGTICQEIFATGLRNPFRMAPDPDAPGTRFFINDVGQNTWEEIDAGQAGADYGWPLREGPCANGVRCAPPFAAPPAGMTNPVYAYHRATDSPSCTSITGGAFVPQAAGWPAEYRGAYLYADYGCGKIVRLTPGSFGGFSLTPSDLATGLGLVIHLTFGPSARGQSLYYTTYSGGGQVRRIDYTAGGNRPPTAVASASPRFTAASTLTVSFDGNASSDPDGDPLTYAWDFGDGATGTGATTSHTYAAPGTYTASLTVQDGRGGVSAPVTVRIDVGNTPPTPAIESPPEGALFTVGQALTLRGSASDAQDAQVPALSWEVILHHDTHTHPYLSGAGAELGLTGPAPEDLAAAETSYLEVRLTATDSTGLSATVARELRPRKVDVTLASEPSGMRLQVSGRVVVAPATVTSWEGWGLRVAGLTQAGPGGEWYALVGWAHGGELEQTIVTPAEAATYTAVLAPAHVALLPVVER
ncbi:MAG TPA: PQQ-dependent sugar dehydrogenase [Roseiflexaceae bacterium]|nr:PQQ-dependent sugar dehydrogenase [Roseiflexaceae bacterium]